MKNIQWLVYTEIILVILYFYLTSYKALRIMDEGHYWLNRFYERYGKMIKDNIFNFVVSIILMLPLIALVFLENQLACYITEVVISIMYIIVSLANRKSSLLNDIRSRWYKWILLIICLAYLSLVFFLDNKYYGLLLIGSFVLGNLGIIITNYLLNPFIKQYCKKMSKKIMNDLDEYQGEVIGVYGDDNLSMILADLLGRRKLGTKIDYDSDLFTFIQDFYRQYSPMDDYLLLNIAFNMDASFIKFNKLISNQYKNIDWDADKLYYPSLYNPKGEGKTYGFIDGSSYQLVPSNRQLKGTEFTIRTKTKNYTSRTNLFTDSSLISLVGALSIYIEYFKEIPESCYFNLDKHYVYERKDSRHILLSRGSKDDLTTFGQHVGVAIICGNYFPKEVLNASHIIMFNNNYSELSERLRSLEVKPECLHQVNTLTGAYELGVELSKKDEVIVIVEKEAV